MEFEVDKLALDQFLSDYFCLFCQSFHRLLHDHQHSSAGAGTIGQYRVDLVSLHPKETKNKIITKLKGAASIRIDVQNVRETSFNAG
jgi:hypothetical protein